MKVRWDLVFALLFAIAVLGPVVWVIKQGSDMIEQDTQECAARGGVYVKQYNGFACVAPLEPR